MKINKLSPCKFKKENQEFIIKKLKKEEKKQF